jgi:ribosomal protein L5
MNISTNQLNLIYNKINITEQLSHSKKVNKNLFYKIKTNFYLKNYEKNRFLFITNLLLLERACGQRIIFVKNKVEAPRVKPFKVGCSVSIRSNYLFNFWKMLIYFTFPKLHDIILSKNNNFENQNLIFLNLNRFLFFSSFSFSNDFDKFLSFYEDFIYYLSIELYSGFHNYSLSQLLLSLNGLHIK